jgi:hypothetical protein
LPSSGNALLIPASALIFRTDNLQVAVLGAHNHVHLKDVKIATDLGTRVLIGSGLTTGERIVNNPPDSLEEGELVRHAQVSIAAVSTAPAAGRTHG